MFRGNYFLGPSADMMLSKASLIYHNFMGESSSKPWSSMKERIRLSILIRFTKYN